MTLDGQNLGMPQIGGSWRIKVDWRGVSAENTLRVMLNDTTELLSASNSSSDFVTYSADIADLVILPGDRITLLANWPSGDGLNPAYRNLQICYTPAKWPCRSSDTRRAVVDDNSLQQPTEYSGGVPSKVGDIAPYWKRIYPEYGHLMGKHRVRFNYTNSAGSSGISTARLYHMKRPFMRFHLDYNYYWQNATGHKMEAGGAVALNEAEGLVVFDDLTFTLASNDYYQLEVANEAGENIEISDLELCYDLNL